MRVSSRRAITERLSHNGQGLTCAFAQGLKPACFGGLNVTAEEAAEKLVLYADNGPQRLKPD